MKNLKIPNYLLLPGIIILLYVSVSVLIEDFNINNVGVNNQNFLIEKSVNNQEKPLKNNLLSIPSINLQSEINEGTNESTLKKGLWRLPWTSSPEKDSNTVIVGHRLTFNAKQNVFYHLDKVKENDTINLIWENQSYNYEVKQIKIVMPDEIYIEAPSEKSTLTLYTCTPIFSSAKRLVIIAERIY